MCVSRIHWHRKTGANHPSTSNKVVHQHELCKRKHHAQSVDKPHSRFNIFIRFQYRCYHCLPENVITSGLRRFRAHLRAVHGVQHPSADESNGFRINGSVPQSRDPRHQTVGSPNNPVNQLQQLQGTVNLSTDQHHQATLPVPNASGSDHQPVVSHPTVLASGNWLPPGSI